MAPLPDSLRPIFAPRTEGGPPKALVVAGACGNVGFGKLGQFARLLSRHGIAVIALDKAPAVTQVATRLQEAYGDRFSADEVGQILGAVQAIQGDISDLPKDLEVGFVFEAIPERLDIKHAFYRSVRERDPEAYIFSATSGFPSTMLFEGLPGAERCGVMHPFFPHLTNKLWEVPTRGATTGKDERRIVQKFLGGLGMNLIPVKDVPSFAADRIFCGMMLEAVRIHAELGLSPAQVDDVCKRVLGTSPFFVHNLIPGANYLSAHCMELMTGEVDSTLYAIPDAWRPYIEDPNAKWPYERGEKCPPEMFETVRDRMLGMLFCLTAYMVEHDIAPLDAINFLCENALAFRQGVPGIIAGMGLGPARRLTERFVNEQQVTKGDEVAPLLALSDEAAPWHRIYVSTAVHGRVGLLSLKRSTLNDTFVEEIDHAYSELEADDDVDAIVIAPDGAYNREFGHGADLQAFVPVLGDKVAALGLIERWKATLSKLRQGKPTVAALVGRVLGGGLELAANCHARIAGEKTRLAFPETTVGVIPGLGGCHHLHRFSSPDAAPRINEVLLTGQTFSVDEAKTWGFVTEIVPISELPAKSMAYAAKLGTGKAELPAFRDGPADVRVDRSVATTNEAGVALDADLRDLLVQTIEGANALPFADASRLEQERAAESLAMSSSSIGVKAMLRGKPPTFENPLMKN
jgi:enoyl-CoA hydratase / 3-hydroxyacyl-CoA dehydrogenase